MKALLADDEPDIVRLIEIALSSMAGWTVVRAVTGAEAVRLARETLPDVILMDRRLPDGDGLEILSQLRSDPSTAHIPIILLTAYAPSDLPPEVAGVIDKPFDPIALPKLIKAIIERRS